MTRLLVDGRAVDGNLAPLPASPGAEIAVEAFVEATAVTSTGNHRAPAPVRRTSTPPTHEYVISRPDTPTPWLNYLGQGGYGGIISNTAGGFSFDRDPRERRVTRYRYNAIPADQPGRYVYLRDQEPRYARVRATNRPIRSSASSSFS